MKLSSVLLGICLTGLGTGFLSLYLSNAHLKSELAQYRQDSQDLQTMRSGVEATNLARKQSDNTEMARLRTEAADVLRLRNELQQLRQEKLELTRKAETAQRLADSAQAQVQTLRTAQQAQQAQAAQQAAGLAAGAPLTGAEADAFRKRYGLAATGQPGQLPTPQTQAAVCVNNLRQIDGAKQQWALEKSKPANAWVTAADILPFLMPDHVMPTCPAGGAYTVNLIGQAPTCSVAGHTLGK